MSLVEAEPVIGVPIPSLQSEAEGREDKYDAFPQTPL